jgi:hypothetical protein
MDEAPVGGFSGAYFNGARDVISIVSDFSESSLGRAATADLSLAG